VFTKTQKAVKEIVKRYNSNHEKHSTTAR
jgi:hypothetical protein